MSAAGQSRQLVLMAMIRARLAIRARVSLASPALGPDATMTTVSPRQSGNQSGASWPSPKRPGMAAPAKGGCLPSRPPPPHCWHPWHRFPQPGLRRPADGRSDRQSRPAHCAGSNRIPRSCCVAVGSASVPPVSGGPGRAPPARHQNSPVINAAGRLIASASRSSARIVIMFFTKLSRSSDEARTSGSIRS